MAKSAAWCVVIGLAGALAGCQLAGAVLYKTVGDVPNEAQYDLPQVPTIVFVENYANPDSSREESDQLARAIVADLRTKDKKDKKDNTKSEFVPLIDTMKVYDLRGKDPVKFRKMRIQEIGRAVGAKQIIYVNLSQIGVQTMMGASDQMKGVAQARVKVVNCETGQSQWPLEGEGYPVGFESKITARTTDVTLDRVRTRTIEMLGHNIGKLFYKWKTDEEPEFL